MGMLASAAWQLPNKWSLVEVTTSKGKKGHGELDAWIGDGAKWWCSVECKLVPIYSTQDRNLGAAIRRTRQALAGASTQRLGHNED